MATSRFNFRILDDMTAFNAITTKDTNTFYLMRTGECYFGSVALFGGNSNGNADIVIADSNVSALDNNKIYIVTKDLTDFGGSAVAAGIYATDGTGQVTNVTYNTIAKYITENAVHAADVVDKDFTGTADKLMDAEAIVKYVQEVVTNQSILEAKFFKDVATVTLTDKDVAGQAGDNVDKYGDIFQGNKKGDIGLVFTLDKVSSNTDTDDIFTFVNLQNLVKLYTVKSTDTVEMSEKNGEITADVKLNDSSIESDTNGIKLKKSDATIDKTLVPDANKLVTETAMDAFVRSILEDYVSYTEG